VLGLGGRFAALVLWGPGRWSLDALILPALRRSVLGDLGQHPRYTAERAPLRN